MVQTSNSESGNRGKPLSARTEWNIDERIARKVLEVVDAVLDEVRLAEDVAIEVHARGHGDPGHRVVQGRGQRQRVGGGTFLDRQDHCRHPSFAGSTA